MMINDITDDLDTTVPGVQAAITLFLLIMAILMIPCSKRNDRWGRKRCFIWCRPTPTACSPRCSWPSEPISLAAFFLHVHSRERAGREPLLSTGLFRNRTSVNVVQSSFPEELQGEISGLSRSVSNLGSSFGTAIAGTILVSDLASGNGTYVVAMIVLAAFALAGLVAARMLPTKARSGLGVAA